jgi:hypothetical protein
MAICASCWPTARNTVCNPQVNYYNRFCGLPATQVEKKISVAPSVPGDVGVSASFGRTLKETARQSLLR